MKQPEKEFYQELFPCLKDETLWQETGATAYGQVRWQAPLGIVLYQGIRVEARAGIIQSPNSSRMFIEIRLADGYPGVWSYTLKESPEQDILSGSQLRKLAHDFLASKHEEAGEIIDKIDKESQELL